MLPRCESISGQKVNSDPSSQVLEGRGGRVLPGSGGRLHVLKANANLLPLATAKSEDQKRESLGRPGALPSVTPGVSASPAAAVVSINQLRSLANVSRQSQEEKTGGNNDENVIRGI